MKHPSALPMPTPGGAMASPMTNIHGAMSGPMTNSHGAMPGPMTNTHGAMPGPLTITHGTFIPITNIHGAHYMNRNVGDQSTKPVPHAFVISMNVINALTQLLLGGVIFAAFMYANILSLIVVPSPSPWPSWWTVKTYEQEHIYLCVFGYMILMSQAVLTFNPHAGWANTLVHPHKRTIHWIMQILGSGLAIIGSIIKLADDQSSFQSFHGIIGIIAMVLTIISLIGGVLHFIMPTLTQSNVFRTCHGCLGSLTITAAFIALILGFNMHRFRTTFGHANAGFAIGMTVFALAGIMTASCTRMFRRLNS